jgi:hypothetical protein
LRSGPSLERETNQRLSAMIPGGVRPLREE